VLPLKEEMNREDLLSIQIKQWEEWPEDVELIT
jgi:hypothetical protein